MAWRVRADLSQAIVAWCDGVERRDPILPNCESGARAYLDRPYFSITEERWAVATRITSPMKPTAR